MSGIPVTLQNVSYRYPSGEAALCGINLSLVPGEKVGVVGGNGAGKTTLLLHLNGCLLASSGTVSINHQIVSKNNLRQIRNQVGLVFKDPDDQLFMPTVEEDVGFGPQNQGLSGDEIEQRLLAALTVVDAVDLRRRSPLRLSAGEKRRVALATVLAMQPSLLVLDEPTDGLDPRARRQLMAVLQQLDHTRLIASHDLDFLTATCSRLLVLHEGSLVADATPADLFRNSSLLAACHLEAPASFQSCPICFAPKPA